MSAGLSSEDLGLESPLYSIATNKVAGR